MVVSETGVAVFSENIILEVLWFGQHRLCNDMGDIVSFYRLLRARGENEMNWPTYMKLFLMGPIRAPTSNKGSLKLTGKTRV